MKGRELLRIIAMTRRAWRNAPDQLANPEGFEAFERYVSSVLFESAKHVATEICDSPVRTVDDVVDRIIALYNDHGYIQARVESTDIAIDRERARVTVTISTDRSGCSSRAPTSRTSSSSRRRPTRPTRPPELVKPGGICTRFRAS